MILFDNEQLLTSKSLKIAFLDHYSGIYQIGITVANTGKESNRHPAELLEKKDINVKNIKALKL